MSTLSSFLLLSSPLPSRPRLPSLSLPSLRNPNPNLRNPRFPQYPKPTKIKITSMSYTPIPSTHRLVSALSYTLPFVNAIAYGRFLFARFPPLLQLLTPFLPLLSALHSLPFAGFVAFFALYLGVVRNPSLPRFVRYNAMQAVVLDVLLAIPSLLHRIFGMPAGGGIAFKVMEFGYNAIFLFAAGCFVYSVVCCILGRTPYLPIVATAADRQL